MENSVFRKALVIGIIILFLGASVTPVIGQNIGFKDNIVYEKFKDSLEVVTIYVDDDAPLGGDGSKEHPFNKIQDAIDAASPGDTIIVYSGVYHGSNPFSGQIPIVRIDKSINLVGQEVNGQGKPLITTCIVIAPKIFQTRTTDYTKVTNFCIEYQYAIYDAIHIASSSFIEISNCNITTSQKFMGGILLLRANSSIIKNNVIYDCHGSGIYVSNSNNIIFLGNTFYNNSGWGGIFFDYYGNGANYSIICHNQFINNGASDRGNNNTWYNSMMSTGNYWYNYDGEDKDGDGIGDIPYNISGEGNSQDLYPLMKPWSERENQPPDKPTINGPSNGKAGESYDYSISATDPDGDNIRFLINWGDGSVQWSEITSSSGPIKVSHSWKEKETYAVKIRAFDSGLDFSDWATLEVSMPRNRAMQTPLLKVLEQYPILYQLLLRFLRL